MATRKPSETRKLGDADRKAGTFEPRQEMLAVGVLLNSMAAPVVQSLETAWQDSDTVPFPTSSVQPELLPVDEEPIKAPSVPPPEKTPLEIILALPDDTLLNYVQVGIVYQKSPQTIRRWVLEQLLPSVPQPGSRIRRVRKDVATAFLSATALPANKDL